MPKFDTRTVQPYTPELTAEHKETLYQQGFFSFSPPPTCTAFWTREDWLGYVTFRRADAMLCGSQFREGYLDATSGAAFGASKVNNPHPDIGRSYNDGWNLGRTEKHGENVCHV